MLPRDGGADVEAVFSAGLSGSYPSPYLNTTDLKALSELCLERSRVIRNIEAFEIDGEFDVSRLDLGLYGEDPAQRSKSWAERAANSATVIEHLLAEVCKERNPIMFQVWLDWEE